jgi:hypothetical protein
MPVLGVVASSITGNLAPIGFSSISTVTLSTATPSVTFANISQQYKHLQLRIYGRTDRSYTGNPYDGVNVQYNGNYPARGHGFAAWDVFSPPPSFSEGYLAFLPDQGGSLNSNVYGAFVVDILDYSRADKAKVTRSFGGFSANGSQYGAITLQSLLHTSTDPVTSITLGVSFGTNFLAGSRFALYGIK